MKRVLLQPAYVLHRRLYRESSFLVELITPEFGRLTVIAKGIRKARSPLPGILQPFVPLLVSWAGNSELVALSHAEVRGQVTALQGACLFSGFYLNELLTSVLTKWDPQPVIFAHYQQAVEALQTDTLDEMVLRTFELRLIEALGYGLLPSSSAAAQKIFDPEAYYRFIPEHGLVRYEGVVPANVPPTLFSGKSLIAIVNEDWQDERTRQEVKRLTRQILTPLLGAKPLHSRRLFIPPADTQTMVSNEEVTS